MVFSSNMTPSSPLLYPLLVPGKTYTMEGIQAQATRDIFNLLARRDDSASPNLTVFVSFFEIYGGRCQDLLNNRHRLIVREDGKGDVVVSELEELEAQSEEQLIFYIQQVRQKWYYGFWMLANYVLVVYGFWLTLVQSSLRPLILLLPPSPPPPPPPSSSSLL